jgi:hypothetical protein
MEPGYFEGVTARLRAKPALKRLQQLRLMFPRLFAAGRGFREMVLCWFASKCQPSARGTSAPAEA